MSQLFISAIYRYIDVNEDNVHVILDIGSRDALSSVDFAKIFPKAQIYAFEANPEAIPTCLANSQSYPNITCLFGALYNQDTTITFHPMDMEKSPHKSIGSSSIFEVDHTAPLPKEWQWVQKEVQVGASKLDTWRRDEGIGPIDLIWMDAQGSEGLILEGARESIGDVKAVITEAGMIPYYKGQTLLPEINEFMIKNGFCLIEVWPEMNLECTVVYVNKRFLRKPLPDHSVSFPSI